MDASRRSVPTSRGPLPTRLPEPADHFLIPRGPVRVIDWVTGTVETLSEGSSGLTTDAQISDDQRLVATTTNDGGWYEFAAAPT